MRFHSRTYSFLLALALLFAFTGEASAAVVGISPASANATVGDTLLLTVGVDQAGDLGGFQFSISFDPAALSINTVTVNNGFDLPVRNQFDNGTGKGVVAASVFSSPTLSGVNLPLAIISFTVKASGSTNVGLANVILGQLGGTEIPSTSVGAAVSAAAGAGPPAVTQVSPSNGATAVPVSSAVIASFSVPMNSSTITGASFYLTGSSGAVPGSVVASGQTATFTPASALASSTTYTATITTAVTSSQGTALPADHTWTFTTAASTDTLTVTRSGPGSGTIRSTLAGINCGATCSADFNTGSVIMLTANPASGSSFNGWTNGCISSSLTCLVTLDAARTVNAEFTTTPPAVATWANVYGGANTDVAGSVQQTADGGYLVAGHSSSFSFGGKFDAWLLKLDASGVSQWQKTYGDYLYDETISSAQQTADGGFIVAGTSTDQYSAAVLKLDADGVIQWQRSYGGVGGDTAGSIRQTADGGFVLAGGTSSFGAGADDAWVLKLDAAGGIQWQKAYGSTGLDRVSSIRQTTDGGYLVAGHTNSFDGSGFNHAYAMKLDGAGSVSWYKTYSGAAQDRFADIIQAIDGSYTAAGFFGSEAWVVKLDATGSVQWQKTYGAYGINSLQQTGDGGYIVVGQSGSSGPAYGGWMMKLDTNGGIQWQKAYGGTGSDALTSVQQSADNGYIAAGIKFPLGGGQSDVWVLRTDPSGTVLGCAIGSIAAPQMTASDSSAVVASNVITTTTTTSTPQSLSGAVEALTFAVPAVVCPDTTHPTIVTVDPADLATGVPAAGTVVTAIFSEPMDPATINASTMLLSGTTGSITYDPATYTASLTPASALTAGALYNATVTTGARDLAGNGLATNYTWTFTTLLTTHTITATAGAHGSITPSGTIVVSSGSSTAFAIQPNAGYSVANVSVDLVSQGTLTYYTFSNVIADHVITASFADTTAPVGSITVNGGAPYANSPNVPVALTCSDDGSGCSTVEVSNTVGFTPSTVWSIATGTSVPWTLTAGDGLKSVYARFTDTDGSTSTPMNASLILDSTPPSTTATPAGGYLVSVQTVTLSCVDGLSGCLAIRYTTNGTDPLMSSPTYTAPVLLSAGTTTLKFFAVDQAGNAELFRTAVYTVDANAPQITNTAPASGSFVKSSTVSYTLNKLMTSGSVVYTRTSGSADPASPHTYVMMQPSDLTAGSHLVTDPVTLVDGVVYSIAFRATDGVTSAPTVTVTNITYDRAAANVSITSPTPGSRVNTDRVVYVLNEPVTAGDIVISDGLTAPFVYPLLNGLLTAGTHTVAVNAQPALTNGTTYTFSIANVLDRAGNASSPAIVPNVIFDTFAVVISNTAPVTKSIITSPTFTYELSEQAQSGSVTFTRSGGKADPASPYRSTLTGSDLTAGTLHRVTPSFTLVDGAFYTVSFAMTDSAGNPATTVSNALVFFDSQYGKGPVGNVDNTGASVNIVDDADVKKLQDSYGTRPGDKNWNPVCDLDHNNVIDTRDLMILWSHYGQTGQ